MIPIYFLLQMNVIWLLPLFVVLSSMLCLWVSAYFEETYGKDPGNLVMDEWAGQAVTFIGLSVSVSAQSFIIILLSGFLLFRLFDILKPLGIAKLQKLPSGWGILVDDLLAGFYALICLKTLIFVLPDLFGIS